MATEVLSFIRFLEMSYSQLFKTYNKQRTADKQYTYDQCLCFVSLVISTNFCNKISFRKCKNTAKTCSSYTSF